MTASAKQKSKQIPNTLELIQSTWRIYQKNFGLIFGFAAWLLLPVAISFFADLSFDSSTAVFVKIICLLGFYPVISIWVSLAIILLIPDLYKNKPARLNDLNARIRRAAIPFFLAVVVVNLIEIIGLLAFIVPGIILSVWLAFTTIIIVLEHKDIIAAMRSSKELTKGKFFPILFRFTGAIVIFLALYLGLNLLVSIIFASALGTDLAGYLVAAPPLGEQVISQIIDIFCFPMLIIFSTIFYLELKEAA